MRTIKFGKGQDANQSMRRKLVRAFVLEGHLTGTTKKIKAVKSEIQRLMTHAKRDSNSARNYLLSRVGDQRVVDVLIKDAAPVFKDRVGGYVRNIALPQRLSDASYMSRLEWVEPVVLSKKEAVVASAKKVKQATKAPKVAAKTVSATKAKVVKSQPKNFKSPVTNRPRSGRSAKSK